MHSSPVSVIIQTGLKSVRHETIRRYYTIGGSVC